MGAGASLDNAERYVDEEYGKDPAKVTAVVKRCNALVRRKEWERKASDLAAANKIYSRPHDSEVRQTFAAMDYNGNGLISLAEIDKYVSERYPSLDNKPALLRAYKATDADSNGFITRDEYHLLWVYIEVFTRHWHVFEKVDMDKDRRISQEEFVEYGKRIFNNATSERELIQQFQSADLDGKGMILFREFCSYYSKRSSS